MNQNLQRNRFFHGTWIFSVLLAGIFLMPAARAQPAESAVQGRFLFVFDTSWAMRNRVEAVQKSLKAMFATSFSGQMHSGDSIGVWTFDQELQAGSYPLKTWDADSAVMIASNLVNFVGSRHYAGIARFESLQPLLNMVVTNSERLTVVIFCDGSVKASGTTFDAGINQIFQDKQAEQYKARQPFIIVLRSQLGKLTGCAMSLPPAVLNIPDFPPWPKPPTPPTVRHDIIPQPVITSSVPSIIIIGEKPDTNLPPPPTNPPPVGIAPVVTAPVPPTNVSVSPPTNPPVPKTTPPAAARDNSGGDSNFLAIAAGLLGAAVVLGIVVRLRLHRKDSSLITRSMNDRR